MANIKSAKKRIRIIAKKTAANRRVKNHVRAVIKSFNKALLEQDIATAEEKLVLADKKLKQAAAKGTIHRNMASRKISRMTLALNKAKAE